MLDFIRGRREDERPYPPDIEPEEETYDPNPEEYLSPDFGKDLLDDLINGPFGMAVGAVNPIKLPTGMSLGKGVPHERIDPVWWKNWAKNHLNELEARVADSPDQWNLEPNSLRYLEDIPEVLSRPSEKLWDILKTGSIGDFGNMSLKAHANGSVFPDWGTALIDSLAIRPDLRSLERGKITRDMMDRLIAAFEGHGVKEIEPGLYSPFTERILQHFRGK